MDAEVIDQDPAAVDLVEAGDAIEKCRLPGSGRTHHCDELALRYDQVEPVQCDDRVRSGPVHLPYASATRMGLGWVSLVLIVRPPSEASK